MIYAEIADGETVGTYGFMNWVDYGKIRMFCRGMGWSIKYVEHVKAASKATVITSVDEYLEKINPEKAEQLELFDMSD